MHARYPNGEKIMAQVTIEIPASVMVESRGRGVMVDTAQLSLDIIAKLVVHGLTQKVADSASGAGGAAVAEKFGAGWASVAKADRVEWLKSDAGQKLAGDHAVPAMQAAVDSLYKGEWTIKGASVAMPKGDPAEELALANAKVDLLAKIKAVTGLKKFADFAAHDKAGKYFVIKGDVPAWNDKAVIDWAGDRWADYIAKATDMLSGDDI
jgi:hypothetical protein